MINIALNTICKNEIKNIRLFLESFMKFPFYEIIINDTGSDDGTLEYLLEMQNKYPNLIKIIQTKWINDFAYSRNECLEATTCGWVMFGDLDDILPAETIRQIQTPLFQALLENNDKVFLFNIENKKQDGSTSDIFEQVRLFPNWLNWEGKIHENLSTSIVNNGSEVHRTPSLVIEHWGYADVELNKEKANRNLKLLLAVEEKDAMCYYHISCCFAQLLQWKRAINGYQHILNTFPVSQEFIQHIYYQMGLCEEKQTHWFKAMEYYIASGTKPGLARIAHKFENIGDRLFSYRFNGLLEDKDLLELNILGKQMAQVLFKAYQKSEKPLNKFGSDQELIDRYVETQLKIIH